MNTISFRALASALAVVLSAGCGRQAKTAVSTDPVATALPGGTSLDIELATPADGALIASPPGDVHVSGTVTLGEGQAQPDTALVYLLDATTAAGGAATCGAATTVLACEVAAVSTLNARAVALGTVAEVGAALFAGGGQALDVSPAAGSQLLTAPGADANSTGGPDVLEAVGSIHVGGAAVDFAAVSVPNGPAQVGSGLGAAFDVASASNRPAKMVVLLSASTNAAGPGAADLVVPAGVIVRAFALPGTTCAAGLGDFAARGATGSGCEDVSDLTTLSDRVASVLDATLLTVALAVDGGATTTIPAGELPASAPHEAPFAGVAQALPPGIHELCVTASGRDAGGTGSATACASVTVATIAATPPAATYELGTPRQTATVTATVAAGEAGGVAGVPVVFTVKTGPNAGKGGTVTTGADGRAPFAYEARQHLEGLGTDDVEACFVDAEGTTACANATVTWQDTTPPVPGCLPGPNPGGMIVSRQGGVSPSGFMTLVAVDAVDPAPVVFLVDTGSGTIWGPFPSGKNIKYTQAPGAPPSAGGMGDGDVLHVRGKGDPALRGKDAVGNESTPLVCPVPPGKS